ncbi:FtsX-like permease family protein [Bacteroides sp.]|uniref:ABC transporter permease n=1 Tax=Bacteroides sp. TaxID=29523 RepID=UPI002FC8D277
MLKHYLKVSLRSLLKYKVRTVISIIGVSLGVICFSTCTYFLRTMYRGDACFPEFNKMVKLYKQDGNREFELRGKTTIEFCKHFSNAIERVALYGYRTHSTISLAREGKASNVRAYSIDVNGEFMIVYPPELVEGSVQSFIDQPNAVIVSEEFAKRMFGNKSAVGSTFSINGKENSFYTIVGVIKPYLPMTSFSNKPVDFFRRMSEEEIESNRSQCSMTCLLHPNMDITKLNERLRTTNLGNESTIIHSRLYYLSEKTTIEPMAIVFSVIGFLVMLTGLLNFMNFSIGGFFSKDRELHLRETMGANRKHLFCLLFCELAYVLVAVLLLSMVFVELALPMFHGSLPANIRQALSMNYRDISWQMSEYFLYITLLCMLLAATSVWRIKRQTASGMAFRSHGKGKHRLRNTMLGIQLFICIAFLFATGATYLSKQVAKANLSNSFLDKEERDRVLYFSIGREQLIQQQWPTIKQFILTSPYYDNYAQSSYYTSHYTNNKQQEIDYTIRIVSSAYLDMMGFPIKKLPKTGKPICIVNREMEQYLQQDSMNYVPFNGIDHLVHSVINLAEYQSHLPQTVYLVEEKENPSWFYVRVSEGVDVKQAYDALQAKLNLYLPEYSDNKVMTLNDNNMIDAYVIMEKLFMTCAFISICISIMGLLGAISMDTRSRQKEVAIRKINGAGMRNIYWLFAKLYLILFSITSLVTILLALLIFTIISQETDNFFDYSNPWYWLGTLFIAATLIMLTVSWQIYRISRLNPAEIIKSE